MQVEFNTNDEPVTLRFEHVGQHPVWRGPADSAAFLQAVADNTANPRGYNWAEVINHAFELHARLDKLNQTLALWPDPDELSEAAVRFPHSQLRGLAGFVGDDIERIPEVDAIVAANGWEHRVWQTVQHMNSDQATCGVGCSGNPYDAGWAFNPHAHGDLHEVGHNVQDGGFKDWPNHAMTNWYSYGIKLQYFRDTGLTEGRGTWMCGKLTFNGLEPLFDIVQQSVHQADPFGYVCAQVRGLDYDDPDDEEAGDYPDASPVNDPLAQATYLSLLMFAERYGALQNGFHLRTLTHIYANSLQDHLGVGLGKLEADQVHGADITAIIAVHQSQRNERVGYSARCKRIAASTSRSFSAASRPSGLPMMRSFAMVRICWAWALESLGRPASARDRATSKG